MPSYNHMVHIRWSIFDPDCCECISCDVPDCPNHQYEKEASDA